MTKSRLISAVTAFLLAIPCIFAVSDAEMEQARVIATQCYLRYANNGSGYLDDIHPKTMKELESKLKAKEKENIKAFNAIVLKQSIDNSMIKISITGEPFCI